MTISTLSHGTKQAFSLVEMSVVLVIVGLLAGGVIATQSMVRSSELKSVMADFTKYQHAIGEFKKQYGGLPGDIADATEYWGTDTDGCPTNTVQAPHSGTCNGSGEGNIGAFDWTAPSTYEVHRAWQQLAAAKYIKGNFSGVAANAGAPYAATPNLSEPGSALSNVAVWRVHYIGDYAGSTTYWAGSYKNTLEIIGNTGSNAVLKPEEAWNIDSKLDDGLPGLGTVTASVGDPLGTFPKCSNSAVQATAAYNLSYTKLACFLTFKLGT